jgi:hypothetical protein
VIALTEHHTRISSGRRKIMTLTTSWVASIALPILTNKTHMGVKELQTILQDKNNCLIAYEVAWKVKDKGMSQLYGTWEDNFQLLFRWNEAILEKMSNSIIEIDLHVEDGKLFFRSFFCVFPCLQSFHEGCNPYLSVNSTTLNGRWNGHIPSITSMDGHNWMFYVAFVFFEFESKES